MEISAFYHADPTVVFRRVLEAIAEQYDGTMAMINLIRGERIQYREIINPHPLMRVFDSVALDNSY